MAVLQWPVLLDRRQFLALAAGAAACGSRQNPPNFLIFLSDQESERFPRDAAATPNRDRLETQGVRFTRAWCATPQCSPARGALWTGRYPHRNRVVTNIRAVGSEALSPDQPFIGSVFRDAGYKAGYFGKWHLSEGRDVADPEAFGFDVASPRGEGGDAAVVRAAADWITAQTEGPWLAIVSLLQPHDIYHYPETAVELAEKGETYPVRAAVPAPATTAANLASRPSPQQAFLDQDQGAVTVGYTPEDWRRYRSFYADLVEDADRNFGVVLEAAEAAPGPTCTIYTTDHGDMLGEHGLPFKGPFLYEELLNIPFVVSWPGVLPEGATSDALVQQIDLLPTVCDLAEIPQPEGLDGLSLRPALEGGDLGRDLLFTEYHSKQQWANPMRGVRDERWKLTVYLDSGERELYDLVEDPHETVNRAGDAEVADVEARLFEALDAESRRTGDRLWMESQVVEV